MHWQGLGLRMGQTPSETEATSPEAETVSEPILTPVSLALTRNSNSIEEAVRE